MLVDRLDRCTFQYPTQWSGQAETRHERKMLKGSRLRIAEILIIGMR